MNTVTRRASRNTLAIILGLTAVATGALIAVILHRTDATAGTAPAPIPVNGVTIVRRDVPVFVDAVGTVTSLNVAPIRTRVDGQLDRIDFQEGQDVTRGALLAVIDPRPYAAALAQAEAAVRKDKALARDLELSQSRAAKLAELGAGAHQSADTLQAQLAAARATVAADIATADNARLNLNFASVRAPIDGRVGLRQVDLGSIVHASDPLPLVTITQMRPISVLFSVPQGSLSDIQTYQTQSPLVVLARENEGHDYDRGMLAAIDSAVDPSNGQIKLRAIFPNAGTSLWPGELMSVRVQVHTLSNALVIPDSAILNGEKGPYVFKVLPDSHVQVRQIAIGVSTDGESVVLDGLASGDQVVLRGQSRLTEGSLVRLEPDAGRSAAAKSP